VGLPAPVQEGWCGHCALWRQLSAVQVGTWLDSNYFSRYPENVNCDGFGASAAIPGDCGAVGAAGS
jgi:hypothetical protein